MSMTVDQCVNDGGSMCQWWRVNVSMTVDQCVNGGGSMMEVQCVNGGGSMSMPPDL